MGVKTAPETLKKTPVEVRIVNFEFAEDMVSGETITAIDSVTITPTGDANDLFKETQAFTATRVQLKLSKGRNLIDYDVEVVVTTSAGQKLEGCGLMHVEEC